MGLWGDIKSAAKKATTIPGTNAAKDAAKQSAAAAEQARQVGQELRDQAYGLREEGQQYFDTAQGALRQQGEDLGALKRGLEGKRAALARAERAGMTALGDAERMNAARIGGAGRQAGETQVMEALRAQAMGQGPSIADMQAQRQMERSTAQQMSMAAGGNPLALRNAQQQAAMAGQGIAADAAMARIAEQQQAQQNAIGAYQAGRAQDIGLGQAQAQLQQQAGLANQQAGNQFALTEAQMHAQRMEADAARRQQTSMFNAGTQNQWELNKTGALQGLIGNIGQTGVQQFDVNQARDAAFMNNLVSAGNISTGAAGASYQAGQAAMAPADTFMRGLGAVTTGGGTLLSAMSDVKTKKDFKSPDKQNEKMIAALKKSKDYLYKEGYGQDTSKRYNGPMAQDLPSSMTEDVGGIKHIDTGRFALSLGSVVGEQQKEIDRLKKALGKKK